MLQNQEIYFLAVAGNEINLCVKAGGNQFLYLVMLCVEQFKLGDGYKEI